MKQTESKTWTEIRKTFLSAGITLTEAAKLLHVTRQTLYNWNKNYNPCGDQEDYNQIIAKKIEALVRKGDLPIFPSDDKMNQLKELLK